jgi:oxygen-independent coproporphyrinogen-3 oxidase
MKATVPAAPLGIYVHIPFCTGKCPYCGFNSRPAQPGEVERYVTALETETELRLVGPPGVDTIYFGGGTPTTVAASTLTHLLRLVEAHSAVTAGAEITVEANPESLSPETLAELHDAGFNRISIGAQSFDDEVLAALGRRHDALRAIAAIEQARAAGWANLSIDLIYGVPGQSQNQWQATLNRATELMPDHISTYCLTIEPGTEFQRREAAGDTVGVGEDAELEMYSTARQVLCAAGYEQYEISNFALPGMRCRHNLKYWRGEDYVGLGAGAHSSLAGVRWANAASPEQYAALLGRNIPPLSYVERLSERRRMDEELILGLRTVDGACLESLGARHGRDARGEYRSKMEALAGAGLAVIHGSRVALSERGMVLANEVAIRIMA